MNLQRLIYTIAFSFLLIVSCKNETKIALKTTPPTAKIENISIAISGMTCEIGCARMIQSKLSKKEGITTAKVIFKDSIANVTFDATRTSKSDIISVINNIADGKLYTAKETIAIK